MMYKGKLIEKMSRDELIQTIKALYSYMGYRISSLQSSVKKIEKI